MTISHTRTPSSGTPTADPYRWVVLAAGTTAQASYSALYFGVSVMAPALRARFHLSLADVGVLLACLNIGATSSLLGWGFLADKVGERAVIGAGLIASSAALTVSAFASGFWSLAGALTLSGMLGASVNAASGRAVMHWFGPRQRGVALGIRQTAIPLGGLAASLSLPHFPVRTGFLLLAAAVLVGGMIGWLLIRERLLPEEARPLRSGPAGPLRDPRLWRLSSASALLSTPQVCLVGFAVLFLHDARGFTITTAAGLVAVMQVLGAILRIGTGRLSDRLETRLTPLRWISFALFVSVALTTALASSPNQLFLPVLVISGGLAMGWNALSFTAAAELAGHSRSGSALGLQQTALGIWAAIVAPAFAFLVASTSWRTGFALVALTAIAAHRVLAGLRP